MGPAAAFAPPPSPRHARTAAALAWLCLCARAARNLAGLALLGALLLPPYLAGALARHALTAFRAGWRAATPPQED